jgi:two-component system chemotaxis response regulator CheB
VVTLDINMPEMDGITALSLIMAERPVPVVMVSSLTEQGALATFEASTWGRWITSPSPGGTISLSIGDIKDELVGKVRAATRARLKGRSGPSRGWRSGCARSGKSRRPRPVAVRRGVAGEGLVVIGVSTGGPRTLEDILPSGPRTFPGRCWWRSTCRPPSQNRLPSA